MCLALLPVYIYTLLFVSLVLMTVLLLRVFRVLGLQGLQGLRVRVYFEFPSLVLVRSEIGSFLAFCAICMYDRVTV